MTGLSRSFSLNDQRSFAAFSGDFNPMHMDPHYARRLAFGTPVVHGAHLVLWAIESLIVAPQFTTLLTAQFRHPVRIGDTVSAEIRSSGDDEVKIVLVSQGRIACVISTKATSGDQWRDIVRSHSSYDVSQSRNRQATQMQGSSGTMVVGVDHDVGAKLFPKLLRSAPSLTEAIASSSRLIGMECPGLNSIFSEIRLRTDSDTGIAPELLSWKVSAFDHRFSRAVIEARTCEAHLELVAFVRPEAKPQPSSAVLASLVPRHAFAGRRALIVGGSRGLGELCAKMLAVGGADVCISYCKGHDDAAAVLADIEAAGAHAQSIRFDVLHPSSGAIGSQSAWHPTHIYYFATPPIFVATRQFSREIFQKFCDYYVTGFVATVNHFRADGPLRIFYPSTVAIDAPPLDMAEYVAAKVAGETVCHQLAALHPEISVDVRRLPRLPTDQTATVFPVETDEPVSVMRTILERV